MKLKTITALREKLILKVMNDMLSLRKTYNRTKTTDWKISRETLLSMPAGSLGQELGKFLLKNNFQSMPSLERHDVLHLLFDFESHIKDEIAMLCFQVGNGKTTPFTVFSAIGSFLFFPEHWLYFTRQFFRGTTALNISNWDFRPFLNESLSELREAIFLRQAPYASIKKKIKKQIKRTTYYKPDNL